MFLRIGNVSGALCWAVHRASKQVQKGQLSFHRTECHQRPPPWAVLNIAACLKQSLSREKASEKNETAYSPINWWLFFFLISRFLVVYLILGVRYITNIDSRRYCNSMAFQGFLLCFSSYELVPTLTNFLTQQLCFYFYLMLITFFFCSLMSTVQMKR